MLGTEKDYKTVYLIDFSLSEKYVDEDGEPLEEPAHSVFKGSISFWSRKVLNGQYPTRADDLESLLYSMMYILKGQLPWLPKADVEFVDSKAKKDFVIKLKRSLKERDIFIGYPSVFVKFYESVSKLCYGEDPDYEYLKNCIQESLEENCPGIMLGEWEPFRSKSAKHDYLTGALDLNTSSFHYDDSINSLDENEYFVNSFTNFKSYDVDEHDDDSKNNPGKVVKFAQHFKLSETKPQNQYSCLKSLIKEVCTINSNWNICRMKNVSWRIPELSLSTNMS